MAPVGLFKQKSECVSIRSCSRTPATNLNRGRCALRRSPPRPAGARVLASSGSIAVWDGGYTTGADLMKFADALMSNELLKAETLAEATRPQFTTGAYGFGFQIGRPDEARTYGHGGSAPGMNAILRVYPESGQSVIVLCNLDRPSASRMGDWLHARMPLK